MMECIPETMDEARTYKASPLPSGRSEPVRIRMTPGAAGAAAVEAVLPARECSPLTDIAIGPAVAMGAAVAKPAVVVAEAQGITVAAATRLVICTLTGRKLLGQRP